MKRNLLTFLIVSVGFLMVSDLLFAHHSAAAYDNAKQVSVTGTVTDFQFVNPHVLIFMVAKDEGGSIQKWQGELTSPNHLVRVGWTRGIMKPGDEITLTGYQSRSGANSLRITKVVLNGQVLRTSENN